MRRPIKVFDWKRKGPVGRPPRDIGDRIILVMQTNPFAAWTPEMLIQQELLKDEERRKVYLYARKLAKFNKIGWRKLGNKIIYFFMILFPSQADEPKTKENL